MKYNFMAPHTYSKNNGNCSDSIGYIQTFKLYCLCRPDCDITFPNFALQSVQRQHPLTSGLEWSGMIHNKIKKGDIEYPALLVVGQPPKLHACGGCFGDKCRSGGRYIIGH